MQLGPRPAVHATSPSSRRRKKSNRSVKMRVEAFVESLPLSNILNRKNFGNSLLKGLRVSDYHLTTLSTVSPATNLVEIILSAFSLCIHWVMCRLPCKKFSVTVLCICLRIAVDLHFCFVVPSAIS